MSWSSLQNFLSRLSLRLWICYGNAVAWSRNVTVATNVKFIGAPIIGLAKDSEISIGKRSVLCSKSKFTDLGIEKPVILRTLQVGARIVIGQDCGLSGTVICAAKSVEIGDGCLIGADVTITDTDFHPIGLIPRRYERGGVECAPVKIGRNVFVGTKAIILKGVIIGDNAVIGAGSVVTKSIPGNSIAAGNPSGVIRSLDMVS